MKAVALTGKGIDEDQRHLDQATCLTGWLTASAAAAAADTGAEPIPLRWNQAARLIPAWACRVDTPPGMDWKSGISESRLNLRRQTVM